MYPGRAHDFLQKFEKVTKEPYSYLVVDLKPETHEWRRLCTNVFEEEASDDMQTDRTIPVEDTDPDRMDTLEDDILSDQMHTTDDDVQSDQMDSLAVDPLSTTSDSLRLRIDVLGTGIEKKKDEAEEEKEEEEEHPDLLACRPCGLVFARA
jgi:hypothetical protein